MRPSLGLGCGLLGSANQRIHLLTERYSTAEVRATPEAEIRIDCAGNIAVTGVGSVRLPRQPEHELGFARSHVCRCCVLC